MRNRGITRDGLVMFGAALLVSVAATAGPAWASPAVTELSFDNGNGQSGLAAFQLNSPTQLQIVLTNTSSKPFDAANGILTSLAFDLPGSTAILGGSAKVTQGSSSVHFAIPVAGGDSVGGEWGYGNAGTTGFGDLVNYVSSITAGVVPLGGPNLCGPGGLDGPEGGLVVDGWDSGGQSGIENSVTFLLNLSSSVWDLGFLENGARIEFGSDYLFLNSDMPNVPAPLPGDVPEPLTVVAMLVGAGGLGLYIRKRGRLSAPQAPGL